MAIWKCHLATTTATLIFCKSILTARCHEHLTPRNEYGKNLDFVALKSRPVAVRDTSPLHIVTRFESAIFTHHTRYCSIDSR